MKAKALLFVSVILFSIFTAWAQIYCQGDDSLVSGKTVDGRVVSVDVENSQIVVKALESMIFSVPSGAKIVNADGFSIQLSDVNTGSYVTLDYHDDRSGKHITDGMEVAYNR